ncbi:hypothetical protein [Streptomyces sp. LaPpAH-108]|uniref:hypothetical protein n=1 Tax=Streptomyces sp. LaPpAH-108 TaxID=1155714 RepID=UPI000382E252|nr:hypothetical protein [Streptomyces sp. LaPpAH-108]
MNQTLATSPDWSFVLTEPAPGSSTLTIEDLDAPDLDTTALFTLCVLTPEPGDPATA